MSEHRWSRDARPECLECGLLIESRSIPCKPLWQTVNQTCPLCGLPPAQHVDDPNSDCAECADRRLDGD